MNYNGAIMAEDRLTGARADALLVQRALESSDEFGRLIEKYQEPLRRYVRRLARPGKDDLDMLLQDIFIKAYENLNDFDQALPFSSWIYRIAHNESIDYLRKKKRFGASLDDPARDDDTVTLADTLAADTDIAREADKEYVKKCIAAVLDELEPKYRSVLVLKFLEEKDYNDISDILRKPPGTVATLIHRAKKEFRRLAEERGMNLGEI
jgi:RNA polymerase sigma-70 factor, ECF subfamily